MKKIFLTGVLTVFVFALVSCATTTVTNVWKNPNFQAGTIKKMMVVGIAKTEARQRIFEDEFAKRLALHGIDAVKSYEVISPEELKDKKGAAEKLCQMGVDAVLATRLIDKETVETYHPPVYDYAPIYPYGRWGGYYDMAYPCAISPGYTTREQVSKLETNVYDTKNEELIWTALSDTWIDQAAPEQLLADFINVMVNQLTKDGVIPAAEKQNN